MNRAQLIDILENHDIETAALERQLTELGAECAADLDEIRNRVYPKATVYDRDKVQATPTPTDEKVTAMIAALDRRQAQFEADTAMIRQRLEQIRAVYLEIHKLSAVHKATLLNLYYPARTVEQAAEIMSVDRGTVRTRKKQGIETILKNLQKNLVLVHHVSP